MLRAPSDEASGVTQRISANSSLSLLSEVFERHLYKNSAFDEISLDSTAFTPYTVLISTGATKQGPMYTIKVQGEDWHGLEDRKKAFAGSVARDCANYSVLYMYNTYLLKAYCFLVLRRLLKASAPIC